MPSRPQTLHISIDPLPTPNLSSPEDSSSSSWSLAESAASMDDSSIAVLYTVQCQYDFSAQDKDQLSFRKGEMLEVVQKLENGWWAAMRPNGDSIGWIPSAFVQIQTNDGGPLRPQPRVVDPYEYQERMYDNVSPPPTYQTHASKLQSPRDLWDMTSPRGSTNPKLIPPPSPRGPGPLGVPVPVPVEKLISTNTVVLAWEEPSPSPERASPSSGRTDKIDRVMGGNGQASDVNRAFQEQANLPYFLRPSFSEQLEIGPAGSVRFGTLNALVEKLTTECIVKDSMRLVEETYFRNIFLTTFRTFCKPDALFQCLVTRFRIQCPPDLMPADFEEWKERKQLPTQRQVLSVFSAWLQRHNLLEEEPFIAQRLTEFLNSVQSTIHQPKAAEILQAINRITFAEPMRSVSNPTPFSPQSKMRSKPKSGSNVMKFEASELARELTLLEHALYVKIKPQEILNRIRVQQGPEVEKLQRFCESLDKLATWVKLSILGNDTLSDRAATITHWIKVAEKCRGLNNFSSMSAIVTALNSSVVQRLHLTWAHVGRSKSTLDSLTVFIDPTGGFANIRRLTDGAEGPGVPFVMMLLTDLFHINELKDGSLPPSTSPSSQTPSSSSASSIAPSSTSSSSTVTSTKGEVFINFTKRQRWYEIIMFMLKFQSRSYESIIHRPDTAAFIHVMFKTAAAHNQETLWSRSKDVVQTEMQHADIRRGLEAAGF